ncbi:MAG: DUF4136 domain-containing protein [Candidatus Acidiferrum sp.]
MKSVLVAVGRSRKSSPLLLAVLFGLFFVVPCAVAKISTDFDPNADFSQLKTFAFIGGVEQLVRLQLNPNQLNDRIHRSVVRELTAKGLREVQPGENPDLVVRYWANSQKSADVASSANWGVYGPYFGYHWGFVYYSMESYTTHQGMLSIELISAKTRGLVWRMIASVKLIHTDPDKIWKTADSNIKDAFKSYPPSPKAIEAKKQQWAKEDSGKKPS